MVGGDGGTVAVEYSCEVEIVHIFQCVVNITSIRHSFQLSAEIFKILMGREGDDTQPMVRRPHILAGKGHF
jgi:hypothetical protein